MKITVLAYVDQEGSRECDAVMKQVCAALKKNGHTASTLCIHADLNRMMTSLRRRRPDMIFNLAESFANDMIGGLIGVTGLLDLMGIPYTGGGPGEIYLQEDKALSKKLLAYEQVMYPDFAVFSIDQNFETGGRLRMPLIVKPLRNDASMGVDAQRSLVRSMGDLMDRVSTIHRQFKDAALAEEYIEGREFYVGVLGNHEPVAFAPIEMDFSGLPDGSPRVMDAKAKFDESSPEYKGTRAVVADVPDELKGRLQKAAVAAYRALRVRDYGRIDLRLTEAGEIYVIEVNANCYLERGSEFATAAEADRIDYDTLVNRILDAAVNRYKSQIVSPRRRRRR